MTPDPKYQKTAAPRQPNSSFSIDGASINLSSLITLRQEARRLDIASRGKVLATRSGGHLSRFRGRGMEFDESRVYQPGDDPRNMDWRVTARSGRPHVKLFREERERPVWLLIDTGPTMRFGTRVAFKSAIATQAAALLAWAVADKSDRVGGLVFDETHHFEQWPAARTRGLLPLLNALSKISMLQSATTPSHSASPILHSEGGYASFSAAAQKLVHLVRSGSLVFLLSDFAGLNPDDGAWLARLGSGNEVVLVHIYDALEAAAPPPGRYLVTDGTHRGLLDTRAAVLREGWSRRFSAHVSLLEDLCRHHQSHLISLRTDQPVGETLESGLRPRWARAGGIR
jgi:uncharacterized protein (DUF58 family)